MLILLACVPPPDLEEELTRSLALVPQPELVQAVDGVFTLDASSTLTWHGGGAAEGELLAESLRAATGFDLPVSEGADGDIQLDLDPSAGLLAEAYELDVDETKAYIRASDPAGLFYGGQTLRQLFPPGIFAPSLADGPWEISGVHIEDAPRFAWRGFMLDVARHFFDVEDVERQIDLISQHKLNRLHLHLTDDQGWRIEVPSWPLLTEIGGSTEVGGGTGGWYTQADFVAIVAYAAARHVTVVPEIDFPGHSHAALASYGELNADGIPLELYTGAGVLSTPLWLDGELTWDFVAEVWASVAAITPGGWIHVGADEAIGTPPEDYVVFVPYLQSLAETAGKTLVGWDEIGDATLLPPFLSQHWIDAGRAAVSASQGAAIVASPAEHTYLDMVHDDAARFGQTWAGPISVETAYDWEPVIDGLAEADFAGVEGAVWTELIEGRAKLDYMVWPRLCAIAEVGWSAADRRIWTEFRDRLPTHGERLSRYGVAFYASPEVDWESY